MRMVVPMMVVPIMVVLALVVVVGVGVIVRQPRGVGVLVLMIDAVMCMPVGVGEGHADDGAQHPQASPRQLRRPSRAATAAITSAATGSAHHRPKSAFAPRPIRSATER